MKSHRETGFEEKGFSLVELVIVVGLFAIALPLVLGALLQSGAGGFASKAENRSALIVDACLEEIFAVREGRENFLGKMEPVENFPPEDKISVLGFCNLGRPVSEISMEGYEAGLNRLNGKRVSYVAAMLVEKIPDEADSTQVRRLKISVEYPAAAPVNRRNKLDFYTTIP